MTMNEAARKTTNGILVALNLPASSDTQNAVRIMVEICWNNTGNVDGEEGNGHRGMFACAIIQTIRTNAGRTPSIPASDLIRVGDMLWDDWRTFCGKVV